MNYSKVKEFYESKVNHTLLNPISKDELDLTISQNNIKLYTEFYGYLVNVSCEFVLLNGSIVIDLDDLPTELEQTKIIIPSQLKKIFAFDFLSDVVEEVIVKPKYDSEESDDEEERCQIETFQNVSQFIKPKKPKSTKIKYEDFEKIMITIGYIDSDHLLKLCLAKGEHFDSVWLMTGEREFTWICSSFEEFLQVNASEYAKLNTPIH